MTGLEALRTLPNQVNKSRRTLSVEMGKTPNYLSSLIAQGSKPTADTLAAVGKVSGYTLALVPVSEALPNGSMVIG